MNFLEQRIIQDGEVLPGNVLKINSFLNHQVDPQLMMQVGQALAEKFQQAKITKVLTCESSGIAPGLMTAYQLGVPMVFARKKRPSTLNDAVYTAPVFSYTKKVNNDIYVEKKFLSSSDKLLIVDDFLAHGEAVKGMVKIAQAAGASVAGVGVVVAKSFQGGSDWVKQQGLPLVMLAQIGSLEGSKVHFVN
jgi:xanthine phosphoribosyltransferase